MPTVDNCAGCGVAVTPATSFITARGNLCASCFARMQNDEDAARRAEAVSESLSKRARRIGRTHGIIWMGTILVAGQWAHLPKTLTHVLLVVPVALLVGLSRRAKWAYGAALAIDVAGVLGLIVLASTREEPGQSGPILILALLPAFLAFLIWVLRRAFREPPLEGRPRSGL